jgi:tetratricopeptide (TPR) repeat protein
VLNKLLRLFLGEISVAKQPVPTTEKSSPQDGLQIQLQSLLKQNKYRQALEKIQKAQRSQPDLKITPSEAEVWLLMGKEEFHKGEFKKAETSLQHSLQLGIVGETHYWLAKCLLARDQLDQAITLIGNAFDNGSLPNQYSICYAKLLLLKGDTATVEQLLSKKSKRFFVAQQQWIRGVIALKAGYPEAALSSFEKLKSPLTAGDRPDIWQVYTLQLMQNWEAAAKKLKLQSQNLIGGAAMVGSLFGKPTYAYHPMLTRLALWQKCKTGQPSIKSMSLNQDYQAFMEMANVLAMLELIDADDPHNAAHALLKIDRRSKQFPELEALRPTLLTMAGQQSMVQGEIDCACTFWQLVYREQPFQPQLALNLMKMLDLNEGYQELQQLITKLIRWLEQEIKQHPQDWSETRRKTTLAYAHCRLADTWMAMGRSRTALGALQSAERIWRESPEVKGRYGLIELVEKNYDKATHMLTEALDEGCRSIEVYSALIKTWKHLGKSETAFEIRRRFGKNFGDLSPETEVEMLPWVDALSTRSYQFFSRLVKDASDRDPAIRACQIFVEAAQGETKAGDKIILNQAQAKQRWDALLLRLSAKDQVPTLQAIALSVQLFAKREKGIAALITQYMLKLFDLGAEQPAAREAHLVILALKERDLKKLQIPFLNYLSTTPQPSNALALIQLQLRRYADFMQNTVLRSMLEDALKREPQNPLLLLAKATTYDGNPQKYEELRQQGFEIARRLQDARALQAFREEDAYLSSQEVQQSFPSPESFDNLDIENLDDMLDAMIRNMFGDKVPPNELKRMLPEMKKMMMNNMPDFGDFDDDDDDPLKGISLSYKKTSKRRRR